MKDILATIIVLLLLILGVWLVLWSNKLKANDITTAVPTERTFVSDKGDWLYNILVIDGCEYICHGTHGFAHKGNCTNAIHIYNNK